MNEPQNEIAHPYDLSVEEAIALLKPSLYPDERVVVFGPVGQPKGSMRLLLLSLIATMLGGMLILAAATNQLLLAGGSLVAIAIIGCLYHSMKGNPERHIVFYALTNDRLVHIDRSAVKTVEFRKQIKKIDRRGARMFVFVNAGKLVINPILGLPDIRG